MTFYNSWWQMRNLQFTSLFQNRLPHAWSEHFCRLTRFFFPLMSWPGNCKSRLALLACSFSAGRAVPCCAKMCRAVPPRSKVLRSIYAPPIRPLPEQHAFQKRSKVYMCSFSQHSQKLLQHRFNTGLLWLKTQWSQAAAIKSGKGIRAQLGLNRAGITVWNKS